MIYDSFLISLSLKAIANIIFLLKIKKNKCRNVAGLFSLLLSFRYLEEETYNNIK